MKKIKYLVISIAIPLVVGFIGNLLGNSSTGFDSITKPSFTPPSIVFPIIWIILYILMGISCYLIYISNDPKKKEALRVYALQLIFNMLWTFFFFNLNWYLFSFIWIIALIVLVSVMIYRFININKTAGYLQIPYLIWLIFASIINLSIYFLN